MGKVWCGGLSLSAAKSVIREARASIGGFGKYQGEPAWVAWLHQSDLVSYPDFEVGDVGERGWAGVWTFDGLGFSEGEHHLFRELRCKEGIAAVLVENSQGFVHGWLWSGSDVELYAMLCRDYGPACSACGGVLDFDALGDGDGGQWCSLPDGGFLCPQCVLDDRATTACVEPVAPAVRGVVDTEMVEIRPVFPADAVDGALESLFGLLSPAVRHAVLGDLVDHLIGDNIRNAQVAARFAKVLRSGGAS